MHKAKIKNKKIKKTRGLLVNSLHTDRIKENVFRILQSNENFVEDGGARSRKKTSSCINVHYDYSMDNVNLHSVHAS